MTTPRARLALLLAVTAVFAAAARAEEAPAPTGSPGGSPSHSAIHTPHSALRTPHSGAAPDFELGTVTARGRRAPAHLVRPAADPTFAARVIDLEPYRARRAGLAELLGQSAGVEQRALGGLGSFSAVNVRGATGDQLEVSLDGLPLNPAAGGAVDLSTLPLEGLARIELYKGGAPIALGRPGLGGALHLVTDPAGAGRAARVTAGTGTARTRALHAFHREYHEDWRALAGAFVRTGAGDYRFTDDRATPQNPADDGRARRRNNAFREESGLVRAGGTPGAGLWLDGAWTHYSRDQGVPGRSAFEGLAARARDTRDTFLLRLGRADPDEAWDAHLQLDGALETRRFRDPLSEIGLGTQFRRDDQRRRGARADGRMRVLEDVWAPLSFVELGAALSADHQSFTDVDHARRPARTGTLTRRDFQEAAELATVWADERLRLSATGRREHWRERPGRGLSGATIARAGGFSPDPRDRRLSGRLGLAAELWRGDAPDGATLTLRGGWGRAFRAPSFAERFGDQGALLGNPALAVERGLLRDAGLAVEAAPADWLPRLRLEAGVFESRVRDLIVWLQNAQQVARAENLLDARLRGWELEGDALLGDALLVWGNATFLDATNRSAIPGLSARRLPNRAQRTWNAGVEGRWTPGGDAADAAHDPPHAGRRPLAFDPRPVALRPFASWHASAGAYRDSANLQKVPRRLLTNAGLSVQGWERLTLTVEGKNLTDEATADFEGYPLPGRTWFVTLHLEW